MIVALIVDDVIRYKITFDFPEQSLTVKESREIGWETENVCTSVNGGDEVCVSGTFDDLCSACKDRGNTYKDCDDCKYKYGSRVFVTLNILAILVAACAVVVYFGALCDGTLRSYVRWMKWFIVVVLLLLFVSLMVLYLVAYRINLWNVEAEEISLGVTGWMDICAGICGLLMLMAMMILKVKERKEGKPDSEKKKKGKYKKAHVADNSVAI